jgi:hypothetical protein
MPLKFHLTSFCISLPQFLESSLIILVCTQDRRDLFLNMSFDIVYNAVLTLALTAIVCPLGPLRVVVQKWFFQKEECSPGDTLLSKLIDFSATFVSQKRNEGSNVFDDEDVDAWEAEARRWARTLLLVTEEEEHLKRIFRVCFFLSLA